MFWYLQFILLLIELKPASLFVKNILNNYTKLRLFLSFTN